MTTRKSKVRNSRVSQKSKKGGNASQIRIQAGIPIKTFKMYADDYGQIW